MASANTYGRQGGGRAGQSGQSYPSLQSSNPLQEVRDTYKQPQEDAYKMQPGRFMPAVNPNNVQMGVTDNRAIIRDGGYKSGDQNFDLRAASFASLDTNYHSQWVQTGSTESTDGRK